LLQVKPLLSIQSRRRRWPADIGAGRRGAQATRPERSRVIGQSRWRSRSSTSDRQAFLKEIGIDEQPVTGSFAPLWASRLISFLTFGEDEVRAWTITEPMRRAAIIHDIERGFIRR
jgi:hypothetical protein